MASGARFLTGSTRHHIVLMTAASTLSLLAIFTVDLVDMLFLSLLGEVELAAAIGYAGSILFFTTSICIGLSIASGALVARAIGGGDRSAARRLLLNSYLIGLLITLPLALMIWLFVPEVLQLLGADGRALELAVSYLRIVVPSMPVLALAMASNAALRSVGDPKNAMFAMLAGSAVNGILDPILIFSLNLGVDGAAWASLIARIVIFGLSMRATWRYHQLLAPLQRATFAADIVPILRIAVPAILTNIATPVANAYVTASMAGFGDSAVAGYAVITRLLPVAFCAIFALSGAVGPIVGQNFGAGQFARIRRTLWDAQLLIVVYVALVWLLLWLSRHWLIAIFDASAAAAELLILFCTWIAPSFAFYGMTFATNATFNNLGYAHYATVFNFARASLGTIPFVYYGGLWFGAPGVLAGQALGNVVVGLLALWLALRLVRNLAHRHAG